jgi:hypothetical protein
MYSRKNWKWIGVGLKRVGGTAMAAILVGAMALAPMAGAAAARGSRVEERVTNERAIDRAEVENLQRWVSAGHADWCKDARLVAAEELKRVAAEYSDGGFELDAVEDQDLSSGNRATYEWATVDGRVAYRVTVERFEWLLPIAKNVESMVWVPTGTEILVRE